MMRDKIYFLSDFHLGAPNAGASIVREKKIVQFLDSIKPSAKEIFLVGDMFDFWFEYKKVVPKGYVRLLGKLAELSDSGIKLHFFVGNHDMWVKDYFSKELNMKIYHQPADFIFFNQSLHIAHGDGLGPGDKGYKFIKKIFRNKISITLFALLPPRIGIGLADYFSRKSRAKTGETDEVFLGEENEWLVQYCKELLVNKKYNYLVFGHRHLPLNIELENKSRYINLGDWIKYYSYAVLDESGLQLKYYQS